MKSALLEAKQQFQRAPESTGVEGVSRGKAKRQGDEVRGVRFAAAGRNQRTGTRGEDYGDIKVSHEPNCTTNCDCTVMVPLERHWRDTGEALERHWRDTGEALERHWRDTGEALERHWRGTGETLERHWRDTGH
ncbi:UNVERIFIED_CONTAM: hypothetical protein FKN15_049695 [Acipenser sinensis]